MTGLTLQNISKRFGNRRAVESLSLQIDSGEFFSVLGPSGCGKTTLLRLIAGFESPDRGEILLGDRPITHLPPGKRGVAVVFQNYALFPRMNVFQNVAFGLQVKRVSSGEIEKRVGRALEGVGLTDRQRSPVSDLSGGEQQRVAVARSIVIEPEVLLFDEPLSNLDVALRMTTRREIKDLQARLGITTVYVTHDQSEALGLSTRVGIMRDGALDQVGTPREAYDHPTSSFVAEFLGSANLLRGTMDEANGLLSAGLLTIPVPKSILKGGGGEVTVAVKPECIQPAVSGGDGTFDAKVLSVEFQGPIVLLLIESGDRPLRSILSLSEGVQIPSPGDILRFRIDWPRCTLFRSQG